MEILSKLFGSTAKIKILRLFLSNPTTPYDGAMVARKANVSKDIVRRTLTMLNSIGFIKPKVFYADVSRKKGGKSVVEKKKMNGYVLDRTFMYIDALHALLVHGRHKEGINIRERLKGVGTVKLIVISGVFLDISDARIDLLVVGDKLKKGSLDRLVRKIESEIGKELRYSVFETEEFRYRMNVYDKLVRDIFEYPHEKVLDKVGV